MSQPAEHTAHPRAGRRDAGFTLPELLIAVMISGILTVSISMAFTTVLRTQGQATDRLAESKDITFVQTWLPVDLSSAIETFTQVDEAALARRTRRLQPSHGVQRHAARRQRDHGDPPGPRVGFR
jgi:prepilin-type N-terminal cleavage/methylation domain-containing protein